jgi:formamidopyrimidine-DNA glycosylase
MHLGMSGSFHVFREEGGKKLARYYHEREKHAAHDHVVFHMSSGAVAVKAQPGSLWFKDRSSQRSSGSCFD